MVAAGIAKPRCIILPFQDGAGPGAGLALHFLLGNVIAAHTGFTECWFGWRAAAIFSGPEAFKRYCLAQAGELDLDRISAAQDVQYWVRGSMEADAVAMRCYNARGDRLPQRCTFSVADGLLGFRRCFLSLLDRCGNPLAVARQPAVLWEEVISREGLRHVGQALATFYLQTAYGGARALDPAPFAAALKAAPDSFMANALMGWACFRRHDFASARSSFLKALARSPQAVGAMAGLVGCAVQEKDVDSALYWAARKARIQEADVTAAVDKTRKKILP